MQLIERPLHPHAGGVIRKSQGPANFREGPVLKETEQHRVPIALLQFAKDIVDDGPELLPCSGVGGFG